MEKFIGRGYNKAVLEVINGIRVLMKVITLSDISKGERKWQNGHCQLRSTKTDNDLDLQDDIPHHRT